MKSAKLSVTTFELTCPNCEENLCDPTTGSHMFSLFDSIPETIQCDTCGLTVKVPTKIKKLEQLLSSKSTAN